MAAARIEGAEWRVTPLGVTRRVARGPWAPVTRAELLTLDVDGEVWAWLREQGVKRPSPSGATQPEGARARKGVLVRLSETELADVDAYAERHGLSRSDAIVHAVRSR